MPSGPGTYGSKRGRPPAKKTAAKAKTKKPMMAKPPARNMRSK